MGERRAGGELTEQGSELTDLDEHRVDLNAALAQHLLHLLADHLREQISVGCIEDGAEGRAVRDEDFVRRVLGAVLGGAA